MVPTRYLALEANGNEYNVRTVIDVTAKSDVTSFDNNVNSQAHVECTCTTIYVMTSWIVNVQSNV